MGSCVFVAPQAPAQYNAAKPNKAGTAAVFSYWQVIDDRAAPYTCP